MNRLIPLLFLVAYFTIACCRQVSACTVVIGWQGDRVLVGNNEDWYDLDAKYWFEPRGGEVRYGAVFFGFRKDKQFAQGGMNEAGLFFDGLYIDKVKLKKETRLGRKAAKVHVFKEMLHRAATVDEALEYLSQFFIPFIKSAQIVIADRHGDYAILNVNGITRRRLEAEQYVVISNFPAEQGRPAPGTLPEYDQACRLMETNDSLSQKTIVEVLDLTHQQGEVKSIYSNVFDLSNQMIHNYYLFDFESPDIIDLKQALKQAAQTLYFRELFPVRYAEFVEPD